MTASLIRQLWARETVRFLAVGAFNTLVGYLCFAALYELLHDQINYLLITCAAHFAVVVVGFTLYRRLVFTSKSPWPRAFLRYNISVCGNLVLGLLLMFVLVQILKVNPLYAQAITICIVTVSNYVLHKFFSFAGMAPPYSGV
jgi:putative flippase GtrA